MAVSLSPYAIVSPIDAATILRLAPEACHHHVQPTPEPCLLAAVVQLALRDLQKHQHRAEARAFIQSKDFEFFCDWLDWDVDTIRRGAAEGKPPRHRWYVLAKSQVAMVPGAKGG